MAERCYEVRERLVGEAIYHVRASSKREALEIVRRGDAPPWVETWIDHTGRGEVKRIPAQQFDDTLAYEAERRRQLLLGTVEGEPA